MRLSIAVKTNTLVTLITSMELKFFGIKAIQILLINPLIHKLAIRSRTIQNVRIIFHLPSHSLFKHLFNHLRISCFELLSNEPIRYLNFTLELWTHDWKFIRVYILLDCLANTDLMKGMFALGYCAALAWFYIFKADFALF